MCDSYEYVSVHELQKTKCVLCKLYRVRRITNRHNYATPFRIHTNIRKLQCRTEVQLMLKIGEPLI